MGDNSDLTRPRGTGLPSTSHLLNGIRNDLARVILPDVHSDRSRVLLDMIDLLLRHVITREALGGGEVAKAETDTMPESPVAREDAALAAFVAAEAAVETFALAPAVAARFVVTPQRLTDYLRAHVPGMAGAEVVALEQVVGGLSKETFLFDAMVGGERIGLVMRRDIPNPPIATSAADEGVVLRALFDLGVRVAEPVKAERDPLHFGMPFQISRKVRGKAISGVVEVNNLGASARLNGELLAAFLGHLHSIDVARFPTLCRPGWTTRDYVTDDIRHWRDWWLANQMEPSAIMAGAFEWLLSNVPDAPRPVLVHGDAGLHNIMIDDGETTAMIDWELTHIGDASEDLHYCRTWIDQVMPFEDFLAIYRAHGGAEPDSRHARFYALFNHVRNVACSLAQYRGYRDAVLPLLPSAYAGLKWQRHFMRRAAEEMAELGLQG